MKFLKATFRALFGVPAINVGLGAGFVTSLLLGLGGLRFFLEAFSVSLFAAWVMGCVYRIVRIPNFRMTYRIGTIMAAGAILLLNLVIVAFAYGTSPCVIDGQIFCQPTQIFGQ